MMADGRTKFLNVIDLNQKTEMTGSRRILETIIDRGKNKAQQKEVLLGFM